MSLPADILELVEKIRKSTKPPPVISIPDWIYQNRRLPSSYAAESGAMDIAGRTPYLIEICKAALNPVTRTITWRTSTQTGKTEFILCVLFYMAENYPGPSMLVQPTKEFVKTFSKEKIRPAILESPKIRKIFYTPDTKGTLLTYPFRGGFAKLVGSNVATDLASSAIRLLFLDEADRFAVSAAKEGDPIKIARKRTDTYTHNYLEIMTSTPTTPEAPITKNFNKGTQEHYHVPCPFCKEKQKLEFQNLKWEKNEKGQHLPKTAKYQCRHCDELISHAKQAWMLKHGVWISENETLDQAHRSFQLNQLYSPFSTWYRMVEEFLESKDEGMEGERVFCNTSLGLPFDNAAETPSWESVYNKRDSYSLEDKINDNICVLVCGMDVQKGYQKAEVYGVGRGMECWHVAEEIIPGTFDSDEAKLRREAFLSRTYKTHDGRELSLELTWIDVGDNTEIIYDWINTEMAYPRSKVIAGVGRGKQQVTQIMGAPNPKNKRKIYIANVDKFKDNLFYRLGKLKKDSANPGYIHYGNMAPEFFKELCSECEIITMNAKTMRLESFWKVTAANGRNEVLDCTVYALCCIWVLGLRNWTDEEWDKRFAADHMVALVKKDDKGQNQTKKSARKSVWNDQDGSVWG